VMISFFYAAIMAVLPAAIAVLPTFVAMPISAIMVKLALRALPYPDGPRESIELAADKVQNIGIICVSLFFLTFMAAANMETYLGQHGQDVPAHQLRR